MVELTGEIWAAMVSEAIATYPLEGCGILFGVEPKNRIDLFVPIRNVEVSSTEYTLDPVEYARVTAQLGRDGLDVVGIMHSHPAGPATPSSVDVAKATHPLIPISWHWVIVGLASPFPEVRSYAIEDCQALVEPITVIG